MTNNIPFGDLKVAKAWLAALFLGEGYINVSRQIHRANPGGYVSIGVSNTDLGILDTAKKIIGILGVGFRSYQGKESMVANHKDCFTLNIVGVNGQENYAAKSIFLRALLPYLVGRKAEIATDAILLMACRLDAIKSSRTVPYSPLELRLVARIRELNRKGRSLADIILPSLDK